MNPDMPKESIVFLGGILLSSTLIPICLPLFRRLGIVDRPNARSSHTTAIPRGMGLVVVASFVAILSAYCALVPKVPLEEEGKLSGLLWAVGILVTVGFIDDARGVSALVKLVSQCASAVLLISAGFVIPLPPFLGQYQGWIEQGFTLLWIVGVINSINFIDGSDGLATTLSSLCMILFVGISRILPAEATKIAEPISRTVNLLGLAGIACALPFLLFNLSPAKCFLGDSGSMFFGLLLAVLGILTTQYNPSSAVQGSERSFAYSFLLVPWLILAVPIADSVRVALGRVLRGTSPFRPDNRHLHHLLHRAGLSPNQMLFIVSLGVLILGLAAAILVRSNQSPFLLMGIMLLLIYGLLWFLKSSYRARSFVTMALNRRLLHFMDVSEGYDNPASFKERFEQEIARVKRYGGGLTVLIVNTLSRKASSPGASPLENPKFLETLLCSLRREDVKCRFSNERLAFLLVETDKELAAAVCERIWRRFESIRQGESADLQVGLGVAGYPADGDTVSTILQAAEADALSSVGLPFPPCARSAPTSAPLQPATVPAIIAPVESVALAAKRVESPRSSVRNPWEESRDSKNSMASRSGGGAEKTWPRK